MKKLFLYCLMIGMTGLNVSALYAQNCAAHIPPDATIIDVNVSITEDGVYWVCDGGFVNVPIPIEANFYMESGSHLNLVSNGDTIYVNAGADVNITGDGHVVYVRNGGEIDIVGNDNIVYIEDNVPADVVGFNNEVNDVDCGSVDFDYSDAPANGCIDGGGGGSAQCIGQIPANAVVISTDQTVVQAGTYWICSDSRADVPGSIEGTFFVESGGQLNLVSNGNTVYTNDGADVEITGDGHTVYIKNGGDVNVVGNNNLFYVESDVSVDIVGEGNELNSTECPEIVFDYSNAPSNGCSTTSIIDVQLSELVEVFPNPVADYLNIRLQNPQDLKLLQILDSAGKHLIYLDVSKVLKKGVIKVSDLPGGVYFLRIETTSNIFQQRIIKL